MYEMMVLCVDRVEKVMVMRDVGMVMVGGGMRRG